MSASSRTVTLAVANSDLVKRLKDPYSDDLYHLEAILPFGEVVKLDKGNANVRPPDPKKPAYKAMLNTVEAEPQSFHVRNRGITYLCERFNYDNGKGTLTVTVPPGGEQDSEKKFGIGDGGHTFAIIHDTVRRAAELKSENEEWPRSRSLEFISLLDTKTTILTWSLKR